MAKVNADQIRKMLEKRKSGKTGEKVEKHNIGMIAKVMKKRAAAC